MTLILNGTDNSATTPAVTGTDTDTGVYYPAANQVALATNGTLALIVDSSQNVGIGTSSPSIKLDIVGTAYQITNGTGASGSRVRFDTPASSAGSYIQIYKDLTPSYVAGIGTALPGGSAASALIFSDYQGSWTERARITSGGNFCIGKDVASESVTSANGYGFAAATTDPYFSIVNKTAGGGNSCIYLNRRNVGSNSGLMTFFSNDGTSQAGVGSITHNGSNVAYNTSSDYRLKENILPMTGALATVAQLKPCTYSWKSTGYAGQGFIAHELAEVLSDAVAGEKDAVDAEGNPQYQGIDTSFLVATLTAAIQEQQTLITTLTERITALEAK